MNLSAVNKLYALLRTLVLGRERLSEDRRRRAGRHLTLVGRTLQQMVTLLRAGKIPRVQGHRFESLLRSFVELLSPMYSPDDTDGLQSVIDTEVKLREAADWAQRIDWHLLAYDQEIENHREEWLAQMERMAGKIQGLSETLLASVSDRGLTMK